VSPARSRRWELSDVAGFGGSWSRLPATHSLDRPPRERYLRPGRLGTYRPSGWWVPGGREHAPTLGWGPRLETGGEREERVSVNDKGVGSRKMRGSDALSSRTGFVQHAGVRAATTLNGVVADSSADFYRLGVPDGALVGTPPMGGIAARAARPLRVAGAHPIAVGLITGCAAGSRRHARGRVPR
jgi:hypothetical protein